jgi:sugar porter (SP) family MFS transporter
VTRSNLIGTEGEWRIPLGLQMIPSLILSIGIFFCPFSPRWLISRDREDEARDVLLKIRSASHDEIEEEIERIKSEVAYLRENEIEHYYQLFRPPLLRPLLLGVGIQILQQLTGINAILYYAPIIFKEVFSSEKTFGPLFATGVQGTVNVLVTIPTIILIDKLGRRFLLISGAIVMTISMTVLAVIPPMNTNETNENNNNMTCSTQCWASVTFVYIFIGGFGFSWGPVAWVYCAEIFPLTMRVKATSLTTSANWATNCAISFVALKLLQDGHSGLFITFSVLCGSMIVIIYVFYPETKGIHLEQNDVGESDRLFAPRWLEDKRRNRRISRSRSNVTTEQNSVSSTIQRNSSD